MQARGTKTLLCLLSVLLFVTTTAGAGLTVSNSAALSVHVSGSNLVLRVDFQTTNGAFTIMQAERPEALVLPRYAFQISNQIFDIGWVPSNRVAQWTLTNWLAQPNRYFRLELEPVLSRGRALVFKNGWIDFEAMKAQYGTITNWAFYTNGAWPYAMTPIIYKQPEEVWLENLGTYDTNGALVGANDGLVTGFFGKTHINSLRRFHPMYNSIPDIPRLFSASNDFRVDYSGASNGRPRESIVWASEVMLYWAVNDYRTRFLNDTFVKDLNLPSDLASNLLHRQFRRDLTMTNEILETAAQRVRPTFVVEEKPASSFLFRFDPMANAYGVGLRSRHTNVIGSAEGPLSFVFDPEAVVADYAGLVAFWILGSNRGFTSDAGWGGANWFNTILAPIGDGISAWVAYRYGGNPEIYRRMYFGDRLWNHRNCGEGLVPCDRGPRVSNVLMHDEAVIDGDGIFPFRVYPAGFTSSDGPYDSELAAVYFAAIFYDVAHDAGLGVHKADLLFWKTLSVITNTNSFNHYTMRMFGSNVLEAAQALWPDGRYSNDVASVLTSRGIALNGVPNFRSNLPPAIGTASTLEVASVNGFGSAHPEIQPSASFYGNHSWSTNGYSHPETNAAYVAYQFYKHSKYGPCDKLALTDGTFTTTNTAPYGWKYNNDGTFYLELTERELGNLTLLTPGRRIRWMRSRQRCPNEATGYYVEDQRPFGFRVIKATSNGFSFTATALGETPTNKTYGLNIVDPSLPLLGSASYTWTVTNHLGAALSMTGTNAFFTVAKDEPFTLHIQRTRGTNVATLTLRERGNDLDRNGGNAFVRNLVP